MKKNSSGFIHSLETNEVFVFGSNSAGRHGKGAALTALKFFGAVPELGEGLANQSYAFPTIKTLWPYTPMPITEFPKHVENLVKCVTDNPDKIFYLTSVGTGLCGYPHEIIAPLFKELEKLNNLYFPPEWSKWYSKIW